MTRVEEKSVSIYIQEDELVVPEWQMQEVRHRDAIMENNPACLFDADLVMSELQKELETV